MSELPTLIILAEPHTHEQSSMRAYADECVVRPDTPSAIALFDNLRTSISKGLACGLPVMLVASSHTAAQARSLLPPERILSLPSEDIPSGESNADQLTCGLAAAVIASAQSAGWLLLPADMPMLQVDTLQAMAMAISQYPIVYPEYRSHRGHPVGFSVELYSELIRLRRERDLQRLMARYPTRGVEVMDPGVLMTQDTLHELARLRNDLQGNIGAPHRN